MRATCAAAACSGLKRMAASAPGEAASKIAAATGLAHSTRVASVLQSHTGAGLKAWAANR